MLCEFIFVNENLEKIELPTVTYVRSHGGHFYGIDYCLFLAR